MGFVCITAVDIFIYFCLSDLGFVIGIDLDQEIAGLDALKRRETHWPPGSSAASGLPVVTQGQSYRDC